MEKIKETGAAPAKGAYEPPEWIEIFKDRVTEDLKEVLQEDLDWTTSARILNLLNALDAAERAREEAVDSEKARDEAKQKAVSND